MKFSPEQKCGICHNSRKLTDNELVMVVRKYGHQFNPLLNRLCSLRNELVSENQIPKSLLMNIHYVTSFEQDFDSCFSPRTEVIKLTGKVT
jgi:hypothetical protein